MANASAVGDGEDVTAEVRVNGVVIKHSPLKLADVTTGLDIKVTAATGLQCEAPSARTWQSHHQVHGRFCERAHGGGDEGDPDMDGAETARNSLVLNFRGIPEGVTVTASLMGTGTAGMTEADPW